MLILSTVAGRETDLGEYNQTGLFRDLMVRCIPRPSACASILLTTEAAAH